MGAWGIWLLTATGVAGDGPPSGEAWGRGATGVLLLHDEGRTHADWHRLGERLAQSGFAVIAPDLGSDPARQIDTAVGWLTARGVTELHAVGAGLGANLALEAASQRPLVVDVVLVSPRPRAPGLELSAALTRYAGPLLVVAAQGHALTARTATFVHGRAQGPKHLELCPGTATGMRLLNTTPRLEPMLLSWLSGHFFDTASPASLSTEVRSSGVGELKTKGVRLDERQR